MQAQFWIKYEKISEKYRYSSSASFLAGQALAPTGHFCHTQFFDFCVIARSAATWQSPGTIFVTQHRIDRGYQEIPTALRASE